jgi:hypothetical protein
MQQWNVEHRVFAVEQFFLEITIPLLLFVFSVGSSMFRVKERSLIVTQHPDGLDRFTQLDQ